MFRGNVVEKLVWTFAVPPEAFSLGLQSFHSRNCFILTWVLIKLLLGAILKDRLTESKIAMLFI